MSVVAIIPARAGSKRLPGKNWKLLCGKPLICWTIEQAIKCKFIDEIIVSTDALEIMEICQQQYAYENRFRLVDRPKELAEDDSSVIE